MKSKLATPEIGVRFNNPLLIAKKFTINGWQEISCDNIFSHKYAQACGVMKEGSRFKIMLIQTTDQLKLIEKVKGPNVMYSYYGQPKSKITSILGLVSSELELNQKLEQFNLVYCCEKYAKEKVDKKIMLCYHLKDEVRILSEIDINFFYKEEERQKFGEVINFYTPK